MIHVLITCYNREPFIRKCLDSIRSQSVREWRGWLLNEPDQTDRTLDICREYLCDDRRFRVIANERRMGQAGNYDQVMRRSDIDDEDVAIVVDGDDYLPDPEVFARVWNSYAPGGVWMTWGSFVCEDQNGAWSYGCSQPCDVDNVRSEKWAISHLRTWKAFLWRAIKPEDLRDPDTDWYWLAGADVPFVFPMAEMAGPKHSQFLTTNNYVYNYANPASEWRTHPTEQQRTERLVRAMPRYERLERLCLTPT